MSNSSLLSGVTVIDLSRVLAGPFSTMTLANLGARVIKVEIPGTGDDSRAFGPFHNGKSLYFASINCNKESIALNLKNPDDRAIFEKLLEKADILVENYRPGTMEKLGYGWDVLHAKYPKLIYGAASGFGDSGPYSKRAAYDMVVQGMGGVLSMTGYPNQPPARVGISIGDITAGLYLTIGLNAALYNRTITKVGSKIDIAMLDCQVAILEDAIPAYDKTGEIPGPLGTRHPSIAPFQTFAAKDGSFNRKNFFGQNEELARLAQGMTDEQIDRLKRGGHDLVKIFAAYHAAANHVGQPTVILAHTKKGYGMGNAGQGKMTTHSQKKLDDEALIEYRNRFNLPLSDEQATSLTFFRPDEGSEELQYLKQQRNQLGGQLPKRYSDCEKLKVPNIESYASFALKADDKEMSTTMAFVRMLGNLLKDKTLGPRVVPIVADEARTFGMANLFKQVGIYSSVGQRYEPEDIGSVLSYREALDGQILEEGISEAGAIASWTAAATSYSVHGIAMLPFYIYYSMFGFQRIGDAIWAAADQRARGFLLGATSGRTTLGGEGLQHQDGSSQLVAATIPNCKAYDPAFAGELAVIVDQGMRDMLVDQKDLFYYITLMNENYAQPDLPVDAAEGVIRGAYRFKTFKADKSAKEAWVTLLGSGAIMTEVLKSAESLVKQGIHVDVYSVTSWSELSRDGKSKEQAGLSHGAKVEPAYIHQLLEESRGPIIAATDYVHAVPESIRAYIPEGRSYITLGTDGFGRSDTRAALRDYFGVDAESISRVSTQALKK